MSKFITTTEISHSIESLIKDSKYYVILIAPYINLHKRLRSIIEQKLTESTVEFVVVCRKNELRQYDLKWFERQSKIYMVHCENLHAKCYLNERVAILTSMNLYEYSAVNNIEYGFLVDALSDVENYKAIFNECLMTVADSDRKKRLLSKMKSAQTLLAMDNSKLFEFL